jgi:hypothetical protein
MASNAIELDNLRGVEGQRIGVTLFCRRSANLEQMIDLALSAGGMSAALLAALLLPATDVARGAALSFVALAVLALLAALLSLVRSDHCQPDAVD